MESWEAETLVYALADTLRDEKGKTEDDTLGEMDLKHMVKAPTNTLKKGV